MFIKNSGRVNELVGSVVRHIEKKGIDGYDAIVTSYYLFTANNLPPLDDDDNVIWGKIHLVQFDTPLAVTRVPRTKLFSEILREQLLYRAVEKALQYRRSPYVNLQSPEDVRRIWHESSTDVDAFLIECTEYDVSMFTRLEDIKTHYEVWCQVHSKKRHMKYLSKKLQPFFSRRSAGNGYSIRLLEISLPDKEIENSKQGVLGFGNP
jgi:phage/plasmid-associated DNA primase